MVEIVEPFAVGQQGAEPVIASRVGAIVRPSSKRMREGIDEEGRVKNDDHPQAYRHDESTQGVSDPEGDEHRQHDASADRPPLVIIMLVGHQPRSSQILNVVVVDFVAPEQDPADVGMPEALVDAVWIVLGIGEEMVLAVLRERA